MTNREAKTLATRLTRVWAPVQHIHTTSFSKEGWEFAAWITREIALYVDVDVSHNQLYFEMRGPGHYTQAAGLRYDEEIDDRLVGGQQQEEFTNKWLPCFRRGLWLSGISIEATAHEKIEWMQGFSCEEIDAWNLKF